MINQKKGPTQLTPTPQPIAAPAVVVEPVSKIDPMVMARAVEENMRSLAAILEDELTFLGKRDMQGMVSLSEKKTKIFRDYRNNIAVLSQQPTLLKQAPEEVRQRLREMGGLLEEVAKRNAVGVKAAVTVTQNILETVIQAAKEDSKFHDCYTDPRKRDRMKNAYSPTCQPVAVDRTA